MDHAPTSPSAHVVRRTRGLLPRSLFAHLGEAPGAPPLPPRVKAALVAREEDSERLIGWVQLGLAATFAILYLVAPKPADADGAMFTPVPFVLAAYISFTIGRLVMAHGNRLPGWLLVLSILADIALLLSLIWLFHLQYGQPAAFSLKVPTFVYIFVFIAIRALRFDYRFVLSAGAFAAAGWLLVVVATVAETGGAAVTRNFVTYLTSSTILIGAEIDKVLAIAVVTGVLTLAALRAQALLVTAVREEAAGREIRRFLSKGVAEAISGAERLIEAGEAAERDAAIMMLDIRGFTRLSATVPPAEVVRILTGFHERIVPIIRAHGGVIDKFLGDGVMATFGAVGPSRSAAADALRALDAVMAEAVRWRAETAAGGSALPLDVNGAVAAGRVVFATVGGAGRLEYTVIGDAVNLAAKLEKHNKVERTRALTTRETRELAIGQGYAPALPQQTLPARSVAGVDAPVDLVVVVAAPG